MPNNIPAGAFLPTLGPGIDCARLCLVNKPGEKSGAIEFLPGIKIKLKSVTGLKNNGLADSRLFVYLPEHKMTALRAKSYLLSHLYLAIVISYIVQDKLHQYNSVTIVVRTIKEDLMNKFRRIVLWAALTLVLLLIFLSIYGAFLGAERAKSFFNSLPLAVYWTALTALLIVGIIVFRRLVRVPALLLIHVGCILILAGSIWGSQAGHKLQKKLLRIEKIPTGQMLIYEGQQENRVVLEDANQIGELPFYVRLKDFRVEYYKPDFLQIQTRQGKSWKVPVEIGKEISLGEDVGIVKIVRAFESFKIKVEDGKNVPFDDPNSAANPALEVEIKSPDGKAATRYVFERFPGHTYPEDRLHLWYQRIISDYVSQLQILQNNEVVAEKDIEVNHPLHFGGYHFYQYSYDADAGKYTILMVVSDSGLNFVYAGFLMLCIGALWHFWLKRITP